MFKVFIKCIVVDSSLGRFQCHTGLNCEQSAEFMLSWHGKTQLSEHLWMQVWKHRTVRIYLTQLNTKLHLIYFMYWSIFDLGQVGCEVELDILVHPELV